LPCFPAADPPPVEPDSTTQNFTFETFEFGSGCASSNFNDVWVFNKNNIWAVGWVDVTSTSGRTNIVSWDGTKGGAGLEDNLTQTELREYGLQIPITFILLMGLC